MIIIYIEHGIENNFSTLFYSFSVDYAGLCRNWGNAFLLIIPGTLSTLKLPIKSHCSSRSLFFSDVVLVSNYRDYKKRTNKFNNILYDRYYLQNCKAIIFVKIANYTKCK